MTTTPPSISALPAAPDPANRGTFNTLAYPWSNALPTFGTQVSAVATNVKANADEAAASSTAAAAQVAAATAQAVAAAGSAALAGATAWVSGTTYAIGDARYSLLNFLVYRRITNGAGTTDPKNDATNWVCASIQPAPIGSLLPMIGVTQNPYVVGDQTWLKTGTVAARATYPNGPGCVTAQGTAIDKAIPASGTMRMSYANGLFVCTSPAGVWTSADALTWTYYAIPANVGSGVLAYCAYGAGVYVFNVAGSAVVWVTSDFVTYTSYALPNTGCAGAYQSTGPDIAFLNGLFVYCCSNSNVAYLYTSANGTTWAQRTLPNTATYLGCAYGAGKFVVTSQSGSVFMGAYSSDGTSWTQIAYVETVRSAPIFANGIFICHGNTSNVLTSATGTSFAANALPGTPSANNAQLAWTGTVFLAVAATGAFYSSASGTGSWSQLTTVGVVGVNLTQPVSNGSGTVLASTATAAPYYVSSDSMVSCWGINRITASTASGATPCGDATTTLAVQATNATDVNYLVKRSGINFRTKQITSGIALTGANVASAWNGTVYVTTLGAASTAGRSSPDGVTWTARTFSRAIQSSVTTLAALTTNGRFVGVCGTTTGTTCTDGATWVDTATLPAAFVSIVTNGSTLIAQAGSGNVYYTSTDGVGWTARTFPNNITCGYVVSDRVSTFAAPVGTTNGLYLRLFSTDGITWVQRNIPTGAGTALSSSCAAGIWTDRAVTFDAGVTWYINSTVAGTPAATAHNCLSMSLGSSSAACIDGTTLLTGVDAAITSGTPAIPNYVRVA